MIRIVRFWSISLLCIFSFISCSAKIPNIQPFAENTANMASAIDTGVAKTEVLIIQSKLKDSSETQFEKVWQPTRESLGAVVEYSDSLVALAESGAKGKEAASSVAGQVQSLLGVIGANPIPGTLVAAFQEAYKAVAAIRARENLREAVMEAQVPVDTIANILSENLGELENISAAAGNDILGVLMVQMQPEVDYYDKLRKHNQRILHHLSLILDYQSKEDDEILKILKEFDHTITKANLLQKQTYWLEQSGKMQNELERYEPTYAIYLQKDEDIQESIAETRLMLKKSKVAVKAWAKAHKKLGEALEKNRYMSFGEFASTVQSIYSAYQKGGK